MTPLQETVRVECDAMEGDFLALLGPTASEQAMRITRNHCDRIFEEFNKVRQSQEDALLAAELVTE